jgi:hypothetical protein
MGLRKALKKCYQNGFKMDVCVSLVNTNPTQLERAQTNVVCSGYGYLFGLPNMQKVNQVKFNADVSMYDR